MDIIKSKRGGARIGAGRKSKADELGLSLLMSEAINDEDWIELIKKAVVMAKAGNIKATELLLQYKFGKPSQTVVLNTEEEEVLEVQQIMFIDGAKD